MKKSLLFVVGLLLGSLLFPLRGEATAAEPRVLLVYDSLNVAEQGQQSIDSLQRLLTSIGVKVDTIQDQDYLETTLRDDVYTGVISYANWQEKGLQSQAFKKDRAAFSGRKLHIGLTMDEEEKAGFEGSFLQLSHRQFTLIHQGEVFQQQLEYQDQTLVLDTQQGTMFGTLETQELQTQRYPFGVIQGNEAFLPMYSNRGAIFLQSAELIRAWLDKEATYKPMLTFKGLSPLNDLTVANEFIDRINRSSVYYTLSSTSAYRNNDLRVYNAFTDLLDKAQGAGLIFLSVPAVNSADTKDGRVLQTIMEETISLLVSKNLYPVGISAPGYWNQDVQYRQDALGYGGAVILEENPSTEDIHYRVQDNRATTYETAFYSLDASYLENIQWNLDQGGSSYTFPMPVSFAYDFPKDKEEEKDIFSRLQSSPFNFNQHYDNQYVFHVATQTQDIEYVEGRLVLNGQTVNQFVDDEQTVLPKAEYQGLFANFFHRINTGLIWFIGVVLVILAVLFLQGNRNYRSKYVKRRGKKT